MCHVLGERQILVRNPQHKKLRGIPRPGVRMMEKRVKKDQVYKVWKDPVAKRCCLKDQILFQRRLNSGLCKEIKTILRSYGILNSMEGQFL